MIVKELNWNSVNRNKWDTLISTSNNSSIYNTWPWIQTIAEAYGYKIIVIVEEDDNEYHCVIPFALVKTPFIGQRCISFPFSDHFPIISSFSHNENQVLDYIKNNLNESVQIRDEIINLDNIHVGFHHTLSLSSNPETVLKSFNKKQIQQRIQNLDYQKLSLESGTSEHYISSLYKLLILSRSRLNSYLPAKKYFRLLQTNLLSQNSGYISLVKLDKRIIAGGLFLKHGNTIYFRHGCSLNQFWEFHPNHFLIWETIKKSCLEKYNCFDFGRTGLGTEGLRNFKSNWGTVEKNLYYSTIKGPCGSKIENAMRFRRKTTLVGKYIPYFSRTFYTKLYKYYP
jgi:hypothetical protein